MNHNVCNSWKNAEENEDIKSAEFIFTKSIKYFVKNQKDAFFFSDVVERIVWVLLGIF